jgi:hypothetical protein
MHIWIIEAQYLGGKEGKGGKCGHCDGTGEVPCECQED